MTIHGVPLSQRGYTRGRVVLHWLVAALVLVQLGLAAGWQHWPLPAAFVAHAITGGVIFVLAVVRLILRWRAIPPPHDRWTAPLLAAAALAVHRSLYALLLGLPVVGALAHFGAMEWLTPVHGWGAWLLALLVALHVSAAALGQFVHRTGVLTRMIRPGAGGARG